MTAETTEETIATTGITETETTAEEMKDLPFLHRSVPEQKPSRNKTKDKEKDHKKQEHLDDDFVGKSRKGKNQKNQAEIKKPQKQEKKKEETIKQIVIPEVSDDSGTGRQDESRSVRDREETVYAG